MVGPVGELHDILRELEPSLGRRSGEPVALDGGITNRNHRVRLGGRDYVVRCPGKDTELLGIDRASERLANDTAAALGIAPAVAAAREDCLVTEFVECHSVTAGEAAESAEQIARELRAFHDSGLRLASSFRVAELLERYAAIVAQRGGAVPATFDAARRCARQIEAALAPVELRPCHNDLLPGNIICARDGRVMLVDWEYAGMGDHRFDLGNLAVNNDFDAAAEERLLDAYYDGAVSDARRASLKLMRVLSDVREAAWGVVQREISALEFDFASYAADHFARMQHTIADGALERWLTAAGR